MRQPISQLDFHKFIADYKLAMGEVKISQIMKGVEEGNPYQVWVNNEHAGGFTEIGGRDETTGAYWVDATARTIVGGAERCNKCNVVLRKDQGWLMDEDLFCDNCVLHQIRLVAGYVGRAVVQKRFFQNGEENSE